MNRADGEARIGLAIRPIRSPEAGPEGAGGRIEVRRRGFEDRADGAAGDEVVGTARKQRTGVDQPHVITHPQGQLDLVGGDDDRDVGVDGDPMEE